MKKILIIIVLLFCFINFVGCKGNESSSQNNNKNDGSITLTLSNYQNYIEFECSGYGDSSSKYGTFEYKKLDISTYARLNEKYEIVEPISISYQAKISYGYNSYYSSYVNMSGMIIISDRKNNSNQYFGSDNQRLSVDPYYSTASGVEGMPKGTVTVVSISGKIKLVSKK